MILSVPEFRGAGEQMGVPRDHVDVVFGLISAELAGSRVSGE